MFKTNQHIAEEIFKKCKEKIPQISNYKPGSVFRLFIEVVASFLGEIYKELEELLPNRFLQTAKGKYLDLKAQELSLYRYPATKTKGWVTFIRANTSRNTTIAKNKLVATKPNAQGKVLRYKVVSDAVILEGKTTRSVLVEAEEEGSLYNVFKNQITELPTLISGIDRISNDEYWIVKDETNTESKESWIVESGQNIESDKHLRDRCMALWLGLSGANSNAYRSWAKSVEGVGDVKIIPTPNGELGKVAIICTGSGNVLPSKELLSKIITVIDVQKPIATNIEVRSPQIVSIDLDIDIYSLTELTNDSVRDKVNQFFSTLSIGVDFEPSALVSSLFTLPNIKSVTINIPTRTQKINEMSIARMGNQHYNIDFPGKNTSEEG